MWPAAGSAGRLASTGRRIAPESPAPVTPRARLAGMAARLARTHIPLDLPPYLACPARVANTAARLGPLARTMRDPGRQARPARPPSPAASHHSYNTDPAIYKRTSTDNAPNLSSNAKGSPDECAEDDWPVLLVKCHVKALYYRRHDKALYLSK